MSSEIKTVKAAVLGVLRDDTILQGLLTKDSNDDWPIYHTLIQHKIQKPCVTVEDVTDQGEVSGLKDGYDGSNRYEWHFAVVQIDCWSSKHADERDQLQVAVQKCLLKGSNQDTLRSSGVIFVQEPSILALDEPDSKPPLWRKSLRYRVFYVLEMTA